MQDCPRIPRNPIRISTQTSSQVGSVQKNAAGMAEKCLIQLSYAIGVSKPLSAYADTFGTGDVAPADIERAVQETMNLTPRGIREHLELNKPIYQRTAAYGHFGRAPEADGGFSWEKTDLVDALKAAV